MKIHNDQFEAQVEQLEQMFRTATAVEQRPFANQAAQPRVLSSGKPRVSSVVCGILAATLMLCVGWNNSGFDLSSINFSTPVWTPPIYNYGVDPHTIEGTAFIHKSMQSGTVNVSKSTITGILDSESMTASLYWTFVLKNNNNEDKEAAITIDLPNNSSLSRATLWINGAAQEAAFSSNRQVQNAYDSIVVRHRDPLLVTQIAPNRIKVLAAPVTAHGGEMQFRLGITVPAERGSDGQSILSLPHIVESNLKFDSKQDIHLSSDTPIHGIGKTDRSGIYTLRANIPAGELDKVKIEMKPASASIFATRLTHTSPTEYLKVSVVDGQLELKRSKKKPSCTLISDDDAAFRLSNLWAHQEIERLAAHGRVNEACNIANIYRTVSSVSGATVLEQQFDYSNNGLNRDMYRVMGTSSSTGDDFTTLQGFVPYSAGDSGQIVNQGQAPMLQGATNGTIGPQAGDATVVSGINTAGTVRVNNLANLEALIKLAANLLEVLCIAFAAFLTCESVVHDGLRAPVRLSRLNTLLLGLSLGAFGFATPGMVAAAIAFMRDANLFY